MSRAGDNLLFSAIVPAPFGAIGIRVEEGALKELAYLPPSYKAKAAIEKAGGSVNVIQPKVLAADVEKAATKASKALRPWLERFLPRTPPAPAPAPEPSRKGARQATNEPT